MYGVDSLVGKFYELSPSLTLPELIRELNTILTDFTANNSPFTYQKFYDSPEFDVRVDTRGEKKVATVSGMPKNRKLVIVVTGELRALTDGVDFTLRLRKGDASGTVLDSKVYDFQTDGVSVEKFNWALNATDVNPEGKYTVTAESSNAAAATELVTRVSISVYGIG